ncbi:SRPBCC family protein [Leucobacter chromiireducens]|uniref:SRPBCC family protein n=1 Tax=Leucobacter chromiireducens TaxID=283877 RepID=UPI000F62CC88|nr:SRPBCC family protein [Leucobacter chromiireducens]
MAAAAKIVSAERLIAATPERVFELIADPAQQPRWDGNDNLAEAAPGQRVRAVGDVFLMTNVGDRVRQNRVVEFEEGRRIAWLPSPVGEAEPGHLWRWELEARADGTLVRHTFDWSGLTDPNRVARAQQNTPEALGASIDRLSTLAEAGE